MLRRLIAGITIGLLAAAAVALKWPNDDGPAPVAAQPVPLDEALLRQADQAAESGAGPLEPALDIPLKGCEWDGVPLGQVMQTLAYRASINLAPAWWQLDENAPLSLQVPEPSARQVLDAICGKWLLAWRLRGNMIWIGGEARLEEILALVGSRERRAYDVCDMTVRNYRLLRGMGTGHPPEEALMDVFVDIISRAYPRGPYPDWDCDYAAGLLLITCAPHEHRKIDAALKQMRAEYATEGGRP